MLRNEYLFLISTLKINMKKVLLEWFSRFGKPKPSLIGENGRLRSVGFDDDIRLKNATFVDTPLYSLKGLKTKCKPLRVYDGDTLWIAFILDKKLFKTKIRMIGYDSAEIHSKGSEQLQKAIEAKEYLEKLLGTDLVDIEFLENDKYGRPLAKLYVNQNCINDQMIQSGLGKPYDGGKKAEW
jgi:endonuclease YncB( thermonuclease family)